MQAKQPILVPELLPSYAVHYRVALKAVLGNLSIPSSPFRIMLRKFLATHVHLSIGLSVASPFDALLQHSLISLELGADQCKYIRSACVCVRACGYVYLYLITHFQISTHTSHFRFLQESSS